MNEIVIVSPPTVELSDSWVQRLVSAPERTTNLIRQECENAQNVARTFEDTLTAKLSKYPNLTTRIYPHIRFGSKAYDPDVIVLQIKTLTHTNYDNKQDVIKHSEKVFTRHINGGLYYKDKTTATNSILFGIREAIAIRFPNPVQ